MESTKVESGILGMADVGTAILMIDRSFIGREPETENLERAFYSLKDIFEQRYSSLRMAWFGGGTNA